MSARRVLNLAVRTLGSRALAQPVLTATRVHATPTLPCWRQLAAQPIIIRGFAGQSFLDEKEVAERVFSVVKNFEKIAVRLQATCAHEVDPSKVTNKSRFKEDLSLDSLDVVEVVMAIEEEFALEIPDAEADKILSIEDAIKYIASHPQAK